MNLQNIMKEIEQQMKQEQQIFGNDVDNPKKIKVVNPYALYNRPLNKLEESMLNKIQSIDEYFWERGKKGGITTGFPLFDEAIEYDVQSGLFLFAASPNVGKSAFLLQILKQISEKNEKVFCEYYSLDDSAKEILPRWIANDQHIKIAEAKNPKRYEHDQEIIQKRNQGLMNLYKNVRRFSLRDETDDTGNSIEKIEKRIEELRMLLPEDYHIVIGIDSFYDLTSESKNLKEKELNEYISKQVKSWCKNYDITVMCTAHLRKLNGRRPTSEDLKETNRLEYEANLICLLYNEVGIKEEGADIYWINEEREEKMPVIECRFSKNKFGSFKGYRFYELIPEYSYFMEAPLEVCKQYTSKLFQS